MLGEIMDNKANDRILISPRINLNFNEDHFYSRQSDAGMPTQPSSQANNLPQSPPSVNNGPVPDLENSGHTT
jgi:hypothetical protein